MERYSIDWCDTYMDELLDKMGSDLFPLPIKYNRFVTTALDLIRETTSYIELNQELSDDIKPLIVTDKRIDVIPDAVIPNCYNAAEPDEYLRLIGLVPLFYDNHLEKYVTKAKRVKILKEGQRGSNERDPSKSGTHFYPNVYRIANVFQIMVNDETIPYTKANISFVKKPIVHDIENLDSLLDERIINLPDISIEKIIAKTVTSLRMGSNESNAAQLYQYNETFGKRNK